MPTIEIPGMTSDQLAAAGLMLNLAVQNTLNAVTQQVGAMNASLASAYSHAMSAFNTDITAGRTPATATPPDVPMAWEVGYFPDATTGPGTNLSVDGKPVMWPYPKQGNVPVCAKIPVVSVVTITKGVGKVGSYNFTTGDGTKWFSSQEGDVTPVGMEVHTTSLDGVTGTFRKYGSAVGPGWYAQVS